ncbi:uncharacterized protein LOC116264567 [Nymphaea colorata]|uniref:uncharacterized protein LOC116264567 n=1 Tax=Nymphaea colorata TaxID=210225 RepID=UPI00129E6A01|nr:uncharacterized protein LOC116264567 [Nymphaea colorata]
MGTCMSKKSWTADDESEASSGNPPEEKVKEVLSETPRPSMRARRSTEKEPPVRRDLVTSEKRREAEESVDVSEAVSASEGVSVALTEEDNAAEVQQPIRRRSSPGKRGWVREELSGRKSPSPSRKREVSPERRTEGQGTRAAGRSLYGGSPGGEWRNGMRRTGGEIGMRGSGRRSRSPGSPADSGGRPVVNRSGSRKTLHSPGRVPMTGWEDSRRVLQYGSGYGGYGGGGDGDQEENLKPQDEFGSAPSESLENPLVSLECFIFL